MATDLRCFLKAGDVVSSFGSDTVEDSIYVPEGSAVKTIPKNTLFTITTVKSNCVYATRASTTTTYYLKEGQFFLSTRVTETHNHDTAYAAKNHNHDTAYAAKSHNHDTAYAAKNHNHDTAYAAKGHDHDTTYLKIDTAAATYETISAVGAVISTVTSQGNRISALETTASSHGTRIGDLETNVSSHDTSISTLNTRVGISDKIFVSKLQGTNVSSTNKNLTYLLNYIYEYIGAGKTTTGTGASAVTTIELPALSTIPINTNTNGTPTETNSLWLALSKLISRVGLNTTINPSHSIGEDDPFTNLTTAANKLWGTVGMQFDWDDDEDANGTKWRGGTIKSLIQDLVYRTGLQCNPRNGVTGWDEGNVTGLTKAVNDLYSKIGMGTSNALSIGSYTNFSTVVNALYSRVGMSTTLTTPEGYSNLSTIANRVNELMNLDKDLITWRDENHQSQTGDNVPDHSVLDVVTYLNRLHELIGLSEEIGTHDKVITEIEVEYDTNGNPVPHPVEHTVQEPNFNSIMQYLNAFEGWDPKSSVTSGTGDVNETVKKLWEKMGASGGTLLGLYGDTSQEKGTVIEILNAACKRLGLSAELATPETTDLTVEQTLEWTANTYGTSTYYTPDRIRRVLSLKSYQLYDYACIVTGFNNLSEPTSKEKSAATHTSNSAGDGLWRFFNGVSQSYCISCKTKVDQYNNTLNTTKALNDDYIAIWNHLQEISMDAEYNVTRILNDTQERVGTYSSQFSEPVRTWMNEPQYGNPSEENPKDLTGLSNKLFDRVGLKNTWCKEIEATEGDPLDENLQIILDDSERDLTTLTNKMYRRSGTYTELLPGYGEESKENLTSLANRSYKRVGLGDNLLPDVDGEETATLTSLANRQYRRVGLGVELLPGIVDEEGETLTNLANRTYERLGLGTELVATLPRDRKVRTSNITALANKDVELMNSLWNKIGMELELDNQLFGTNYKTIVGSINSLEKVTGIPYKTLGPKILSEDENNERTMPETLINAINDLYEIKLNKYENEPNDWDTAPVDGSNKPVQSNGMFWNLSQGIHHIRGKMNDGVISVLRFPLQEHPYSFVMTTAAEIVHADVSDTLSGKILSANSKLQTRALRTDDYVYFYFTGTPGEYTVSVMGCYDTQKISMGTETKWPNNTILLNMN